MDNIELAHEKYHIVCSYEDAILYCFSLNIDGKSGWRLPTLEEYGEFYKLYGWTKNEVPGGFKLVWPVRDII